MFTIDEINLLSDEEFIELEKQIDREMSVWQVCNLRGQAAIFHDDQHMHEDRKELKALDYPGFNVEAEMKFRNTKVIDSLKGNMLIHPLTTPVVEVNEDNTVVRATWWSLGIEGLSIHEEKPTAIISVGVVPGVHVKQDDEWRILKGAWIRTTKNEYHAGWIDSMLVTNTRPPLTVEQDRQLMGKYAYRKDEVRKAVPCPPLKDTYNKYPKEDDDSWLYEHIV